MEWIHSNIKHKCLKCTYWNQLGLAYWPNFIRYNERKFDHQCYSRFHKIEFLRSISIKFWIYPQFFTIFYNCRSLFPWIRPIPSWEHFFKLQIATTKNEQSQGNTAWEITDNIRFFCILNERLLFIVLWNSNYIRHRNNNEVLPLWQWQIGWNFSNSIPKLEVIHSFACMFHSKVIFDNPRWNVLLNRTTRFESDKFKWR